MHQKKRHYEMLALTTVAVFADRHVLASSIVDNALITSVGQELGPSYDMSQSTDTNTGKTFSHEWDEGGSI